ncbi:hypothetical protein ACVIW2_008383 [Bradyrhizobium huanghuaihaiense]|uniref:TubC N-terminal docking domain-containing protein n=1 Tax=Bradyrhizobium huanghuaihaiense TaxID=990078 RepID=A0A562RGK1_9BRAD|nr:hypothetical protein [Bradyrhizobium huanghuaihaiense]TWI68239.1 hypothetical protein IQ16_04083 [Bradyrhizobium huanghuaihaiense]
MTVCEALSAARAAGICLVLDGHDLLLTAAEAPPDEVLSALSRHKPEIVTLLRSTHERWSEEDWLAFFDERAGIAEFDGGMERRDAEARALECCVVEWLNRNPVCSPPGRCLHCGGSEATLDELVPFGTELSGHVWLHSRCWAAWHGNRNAMAAAVLSAILRGR